MPRSRAAVLLTAPALVLSALVTVTTISVATAPSASAASLTRGNLTMVSTRADGTSGPALPSTFGADEVAVSDDGKVIAFTSPVPADQLVTDPLQTGHVTDNNDSAPTQAGKLDVFVYDSRVPAPVGPIVSLVSWNAAHTGTGNAASQHPVMAPAGVGIVFESGSTNLVSVPVGPQSRHLYAWAPFVSNVFSLQMVDVNFSGSAGSDSVSQDPSIGISLVPPAIRVAFTSSGTDLVDPAQHDSHGIDQVYVRTFTAAPPSTQLVSVDKNDPNGTASGADEPQISADGNHVVFSSGGDGLMGPGGGTGGDIFERNLLTSSTTLISAAGGVGTGGNNSPVVSADGTAVAWDGNAPNLSSTPHNTNAHVFYRKAAGPVLMVDTNSTGTVGCANGASNWPGLSADGTMVVFESFCTDIAAGTSGTQVYARRMTPAPSVPAAADFAPQLISANDAGTGGGNADAFLCSGSNPPNCGAGTDPGVTVNADGTEIVFFSSANDIGAATPPFSSGNVFVRYPYAQPHAMTVNLTTNAGGKNANGVSRDAVVSKDGGTVGLVSLADDLVTPDNNASTDVFAVDLKNTYVIQPISPVNESDGTVTVTVARTGPAATSDSVEVATGDGFDTSIAPNPFPGTTQAFEPGDYDQTDTTVPFPPGVMTQTFTVGIADDNAPEGPEAFHITLSPHSGAVNVPGPGPLSYAYVEILDNDGVSQDWSASNTLSPGSAEVGDTVTVKTTISVDPGGQDLQVTSLGSGVGTTGLDSIVYDTPAPFTVPAGTSTVVTATARVVAAPGTPGVKLQTAVQGQLGAASAIRTADSGPISVAEAVTGLITGAPATVALSDQIVYTLTLTNSSDTAAELTVPTLTAPVGTTAAGAPTDCATTLAPGANTSCTLTVDVDDSDADQTVVTFSPGGVTYAMSAASLPNRPVALAPAVSTVQAPVVTVAPHTLTDVNSGTLQAGDVVHVSVTVNNSGAADATNAVLVDTLANLDNATNIQLGGAACGACTFGSGAVTAPLGTLAANGGSAVLTFDATVPGTAVDNDVASSSVVVTFDGGTTGTSPTPADIKTLTVGSTNQSWHVSISQPPPATANVGDEFVVKALISVDPGPDSLSISSVDSGPATSGIVTPGGSFPPGSVPGGGSVVADLPARVVANPGAGGVQLEVKVTAVLSGPTESMSATTGTITVTDAVSATLTGGPATVTTADQITYQLTLTNNSDNDANVAGLPAALTAPAGTTAVGPASGPTTVTANSSGTWTLTVDVDDADVNGQVLTQTPGAVSYDMPIIGVPTLPMTITPTSVSSTIGVPDVTKPDVTINKAAGQADPATGTPVHFTATFTEPVSGFDSADVLLGSSTAGGPMTTVITGGPITYDVAVSGMSQSGKVVATVAAGGAQDGSGNLNTASTSSDNSVDWIMTIASHTLVTTAPASTVYGQPVTATATVTFDSGSSPGTVQFSVDGVDQGAAVPLAGGLAHSAALTGPGGVPLDPGTHSIGAAFTPTALPYISSNGSTSMPVSKASTTTAVTVGTSTVTATVAPVAPGTGAPSGSVAFQVNGSPVGTAPVGAGGVATLTYTVPSGATQNVGAAYGGDTHFSASSASTSRNDPSITAKVTSAKPKSKFGWYRTPVKVTFTCATNGAALVAPCPDPVTVNKNGGGQSISKTITAQDGGMDTVTVDDIDIDQAAPLVSVGGVTKGGHYPAPGPKPTCVGKDGLSGIASCTVHTKKTGGAVSTTVHYTVRAVDKAGNVATKKGSYTVSGAGFKGAPFKNGAFTMHLGRTYQLVVHSASRPRYLDAAPFPHKPFKVDPFPFRSAGHNLWTIPILMESALAVHTYWNVGVLINGHVTVIKIRVLP